MKLSASKFHFANPDSNELFKDAKRTQQTERMEKLFVLFLAIISASGFKFNTPRILLPVFDDVRVNYTLTILEPGCFDFS